MSGQVVGNIHMSTQRLGHDCTFTWRLRNLSFLSSMTQADIQQEFALHPKCDTTWTLKVSGTDEGYKVVLGTKYSSVPKTIEPSYIGLLNREGQLALPERPDSADESEKLCLVLKLRSGKGNTMIMQGGVEVKLDGDTLMVKGRVVVPSCCVRTEIDKEEIQEVPKATNAQEFCQLMKDDYVVA